MRRYYNFNNVWFFLAAFGLLLTVCALPADADIYQWKDASGKTHFSDKKPQDLPAEQINPKVNSFTGVAIEPALKAPAPATPAPKPVVMYSTQRCGYCKQARAYFKKAGIAYREYDIDASESARRQYDKAGGRGVPLIFIGKSRMDGFSAERFNWLYQQ